MVEMVNFQITSTLTSFASEKRFPKDCSVLVLKGKLELITGSSSGFMHLELYDKDNKFICTLDNDESLLGSYPVEDGNRIHVIDKDPSKKAGEFEDLSKVEKYEMADDAYENRSDSVRNFLKQKKMGKYSENAQQQEERVKQKEMEEEIKAKTLKVGDRCEVSVPKQPTKRGNVMYVGLTEFKPGWWVGVKYDEPLGKNDGRYRHKCLVDRLLSQGYRALRLEKSFKKFYGRYQDLIEKYRSVQGKRYFKCEQKYGGFVRPSQLTVGDFPEEDLGFDEM